MKYRLALRCALFVSLKGYTRRQVFDHMKQAYNVRSQIVHGSQVEGNLKSPTGAKVSLAEFIVITEAIVRSALRTTLKAQATSPGERIDWEGRILDSPKDSDGVD